MSDATRPSNQPETPVDPAEPVDSLRLHSTSSTSPSGRSTTLPTAPVAPPPTWNATAGSGAPGGTGTLSGSQPLAASQPPTGRPAPTDTPTGREPAAPAKKGLTRGAAAVLALVAVAGGTVGGAVAGRATAPDTAAVVADTEARSAAIDGPVASSPVDISGLVEAVRPSVVRIDAVSSSGSGTGTGFVISADGRIATNAHVVGDATTVEVEFSDGSSTTAIVLGAAPSEDLAVIRVDRDGLTPVEFGSSADLSVGERVVAIGNSLGFEGSATATEGIVSALDRAIRTEDGNRLTDLIQTDAAINPGNSGGPLFDLDGKVVGINSAGSPWAQNVGFAIAADEAQPILETLSEGEPVLEAFLGISSAPLTVDLAAQLGLEPERVADGDLEGAVVLDVSVGSAAEAAGLQVGDLLVAIDGEVVESPETVGDSIGAREPGDMIELTIVRDGAEETLDAVLGSRRA